MNKINIHNYELFFLDYFEGNLSKLQMEDVDKFIFKNIELKDEFDSFENIKLKPSKIEYKQKENLKKQTQSQFFDITNFEYLAVSDLEGDISINEKEELKRIVKKNKELFSYLKILKNTKLQAEKSITFNYKTKLKRNIIPIYIKYSSMVIAAIFTLIFLINKVIYIDNEVKTIQLANFKQDDVKTNDIKKTKYQKQENIKKTNKKQKFSISHKQINNKLTTNKIFAFDDKESQKNVNIYKKLNVSIPDLKTETLIFEKNKLEIKSSYNDVAFTKTEQEKDRLWKYAETGIKVWKLLSSSDLDMNNKYKKDGSIEKLNVYASNFRFSKTFNR